MIIVHCVYIFSILIGIASIAGALGKVADAVLRLAEAMEGIRGLYNCDQRRIGK